MQKKVLCLFQQDLRLGDNPALNFALQCGQVYPTYIFDTTLPSIEEPSITSRFWLHHSLKSLENSLENKLSLYEGATCDCVIKLCKKHKIDLVVWNRCYEPSRISIGKNLKSKLSNEGIETKSFNGSLLIEPWDLLKEDGTPYKVFTAMYKKAYLNKVDLCKPARLSTKKSSYKKFESSKTIESLKLLHHTDREKKLSSIWNIGEENAKKKLDVFLRNRVSLYKKKRDFPIDDITSKLSPHLHFGEISAAQIWAKTQRTANCQGKECFLSELAWREFSYYQLYHFPKVIKSNLKERHDQFPWTNDNKQLRAWQKGQTGYPLVDAGMRQLIETGFMHNRVRMVVGSFLTKNLLTHWKYGAAWFWKYLVDADLASNSASWQWVAGSGLDAAPYFRIFNPTTQAKKFDPEGEFIRKFVPELADLPTKYIFEPWKVDGLILKESNVTLGKTYPYPIVELDVSRKKALDAYAKTS